VQKLLSGIIFGLGLSELVLILVFIILILGPKKMKSIKPFLKVAYKNYLRYMREVDAMQGEMDDMKKTLMEPIEEVKSEAVAELKDVETEISEGMEGAEELKKGMQSLVDRSKKEMAEAREEAKRKKMMEGSKSGKKMPVNAVHITRGSQVGLLGKQGPGSSRRMPNAGRVQQMQRGIQNRFGQKQKQSSFRFGGTQKSQVTTPQRQNQQVSNRLKMPQKEAPPISAAGAIHIEEKPVKKESSKKQTKPKAKKTRSKVKKKSSKKGKGGEMNEVR
jgi:Sec-independent protein translocase protein TatA